MLDEPSSSHSALSPFGFPLKNFILFLHNSGDILHTIASDDFADERASGAGFRPAIGSARRDISRVDGPVERITW